MEAIGEGERGKGLRGAAVAQRRVPSRPETCGIQRIVGWSSKILNKEDRVGEQQQHPLRTEKEEKTWRRRIT
jgi:hypothetical protein